MFCEYCGKLVAGDAIYCRYCGLKIKKVRKKKTRDETSEFDEFLDSIAVQGSVGELGKTADSPPKQDLPSFRIGKDSIKKLALVLSLLTVVAVFVLSIALAMKLAASPESGPAIKDTIYLPDSKILLSLLLYSNLSEGGNETSLANGTLFAVGEAFYPVQHGLPYNTTYSFQVLGINGSQVIAYSDYGANVTSMEGLFEGIRVLNQPESPLLPGNYTIELIKVDDGLGIIVSRLNFSIFENITAVEEEVELPAGPEAPEIP